MDIKGSVDLKGRGNDVELQNIAGPVTSSGAYVGEIQLRNLEKPVRWDDPLNSLGFERLPGEIRIGQGEFHANNVVGPIRLKARSPDVEMSNFTQSLELTIDRGDIDLKPGKDVPKMEVHTRSGDITLALAPGSKVDLKASTDRGDASNDYGEPLREEEAGHGATIEGSTGGPQVRLETGRGSLTIRKASAAELAPPEAPSTPIPPQPAKPGLKVEHE